MHSFSIDEQFIEIDFTDLRYRCFLSIEKPTIPIFDNNLTGD